MSSKIIVIAPLMVILFLSGYQMYDYQNTLSTVDQAKVQNVIQQCDKSNCHTVVLTDKGTFIVAYGLGGISYENYVNITGTIEKGKTFSFETMGKKENFAYIPFFKMQFPSITKIIN